MRSTLNLTKITPGLCCKLWAECAVHVTDIENIIVYKINKMSLLKKFYGKAPHFTLNIVFFGETGIVQIYNKQIKTKLDNHGIPCMLMG